MNTRNADRQTGREQAADESAPATLALRLLSVVPFVLLGALGVIATVSWFAVLVLGVGLDRGAVWSWAEGRPFGDSAGQVALLLLIGAACGAVVVVSIYATMRGFGDRQPAWFWPLSEAVCLLIGGTLLFAQARAPQTLSELGLTGLDWIFTLAVVTYSAVVIHLRWRHVRRAALPSSREDAHEK